MPYPQTSVGTQSLSDVSVKISRATINPDGLWNYVSGSLIEFSIDKAKIDRAVETFRADPGQDPTMAEAISKTGYSITIDNKAQYDEWTAGKLLYEIEQAGGGFWENWIVNIYHGGAWVPYYCVITGYNVTLDDPGELSLSFSKGRS